MVVVGEGDVGDGGGWCDKGGKWRGEGSLWVVGLFGWCGLTRGG